MNRIFACAILIGTLTTPAFGQWHRLRLGIETGVPLNDAFHSKPANGLQLNQRDGRKALAGVSAETPLPWNMAVRVGFLYRTLAFHRTQSGIPVYNGFSAGETIRNWEDLRGDAWDVPVAIKKGFSENRRVKPFVDAGITVRYTDVTMTKLFSSGTVAKTSGPFSSKARDWHAGAALGAGVDIDVLPFRLSPEVRWTNWLDNWRPSGDALDVGPARQSVDFLLGFKFK